MVVSPLKIVYKGKCENRCNPRRRSRERSIDPILGRLKREARSRRQITRELAIWPPARCTRVSRDRARASVEPGRLLDNGNNKVGQEKGQRGGEEYESS